MHGPIDYIVVGFEDAKFDGSILKALADASDKGIIAVLALSVVNRDESGVVTTVDIADLGDSYAVEFAQKYPTSQGSVTTDDIDEVGELLEDNTAAGLLIIEQLWAKPLKEALIKANGFLISEGRIHPEAAKELDEEG